MVQVYNNRPSIPHQHVPWWRCSRGTDLLDEVHALGRLHPVGVVHDVGDVVLCTQRGQLLNPAKDAITITLIPFGPFSKGND